MGVFICLCLLFFIFIIVFPLIYTINWCKLCHKEKKLRRKMYEARIEYYGKYEKFRNSKEYTDLSPKDRFKLDNDYMKTVREDIRLDEEIRQEDNRAFNELLLYSILEDGEDLF